MSRGCRNRLLRTLYANRCDPSHALGTSQVPGNLTFVGGDTGEAPVSPLLEEQPCPTHREAADRLVAHSAAHNQGVRGHTLVWYAQLPSWLRNGNFSTTELNTILKSPIDTEMGRYKGKVYAWDVVNEAFSEDGSMRSSLWQDRLGTGYIANALRWAHTADPDVPAIRRGKRFRNSRRHCPPASHLRKP
ncbi:endo-1,4-beta-xylanase [Streptomyces sp. NPDC050263]|uniref:endo-1,4-beta-xylanase n=1 Tax=Streptomyces sp. NPDC050263 TaxID=3155037 RepID=UPI00341C8FB7